MNGARRLCGRIAAGAAVCLLAVACGFGPAARAEMQREPLEFIEVSEDGTHFVGAASGRRFVAWGFNYDHDAEGRLIEDYWEDAWGTVVEDFREMRALGANVVRVHLQLGRLMEAPDAANETALARLVDIVKLAEETGLYLDVTGLGCYHKEDVPQWYEAMGESERWEVQARFWEAVARMCAESPAVFCYDLMNEPIVAGAKKKETEWLAGAFGGKYFVQRITLDLAGRTRQQVAKAWVEKLVAAIRTHDKDHMITLGAIPWAHTWPSVKPLFYSPEVGGKLDFVSVHFYPHRGEVDKALRALSVYEIGKPLVVEEMFPLRCSIAELDAFIDGSRGIADGYIGFYWGERLDEGLGTDMTIAEAVTGRWLRYFHSKRPEVVGSHREEGQ